MAAKKRQKRESQQREPAARQSADSQDGHTRHVKLVRIIGRKVDKMIDHVRDDPNSDSCQMVRVLLLNQLTEMKEQTYQEKPAMVLTEERRRGPERERQAGLDQQNVKWIKLRSEKLRMENEDARAKLEQAQKAAQEAAKRIAEGRPMDPLTVYNKIFEIVGLGSPAEAQQAASSEQRAGSGEP